MIKKIPIKQIKLKPNFPYKERKLKRYREQYSKGHKFPAIRVKPEYKIEDGYHRLEALKQNGQQEVYALINGEQNKVSKKNYRTFLQLIKNCGCHSSGAIKFIWDYFCESEPQNYVEIGVYKGTNAEKIRKIWPETEMLLIDPWKRYYAQPSQDAHDKHYQETKDRFKDDKKTRIVRKTSLDGARDVLHERFDIVFIDGNHLYQPVIDDINAWYPLVKPGGVLCGHDYSPDHPEVSRAVIDTLGKKHTFTGKGFGDVWFHIKDNTDVSIAMVASKPKYQLAARVASATYYKFQDMSVKIYVPQDEKLVENIRGEIRYFPFKYDKNLRYTTQLKPQAFLQIIDDLKDDEIVIIVDSDTYCIRNFDLPYKAISEAKEGKLVMVPEPWNRYGSLHNDSERPDYIPENKRLTYVNSGVIIASKKSRDIFEKILELSQDQGFHLGPLHDQTIINYVICHYFPDRIYYLDKRWNGICTTDPETTIIGHNGGGVGVKSNRHVAVCKAIIADKDWFKIFKSYDKPKKDSSKDILPASFEKTSKD